MPKLYPPLGKLGIGTRFNKTLHGRSIYRPVDVPGHNVFRGYSDWERDGKGHGDGVDLFCAGGTPVYAMEDCKQTLHRNDASRLEVVYLRGSNALVVMGHIDAVRSGVGVKYKRGDVVGHVRGDLKDPHVHLEIALKKAGAWVPIAAHTGNEFANKLREIILPAIIKVVLVSMDGILGTIFSLEELGKKFKDFRLVPGGDHIEDQGKVYVSPI